MAEAAMSPLRNNSSTNFMNNQYEGDEMLGSDKDMKKVKEYRAGGEFIFTTPKEGEQFYLAPYGFYSDNSMPFIEVYKDGELTHSVNCAYVVEVRFDT